MFDWNEIKAKADSFLTEASRTVKIYTPENWSKEKKFVNALVASIALMTVSDRKVDTREVKASMDMINNIDQITELNMQSDAIQLFELHLEKLLPNVENGVKLAIETGKLLGDISKIKEYPEYVPMIKNLIEYIASSDGGVSQDELDMSKRILGVLN